MATRRGKRPSRGTPAQGEQRRYVRRDSRTGRFAVLGGRGGASSRSDAPARVVAVSKRMLEDLADGEELGRRLADPESAERIPWSETKARLGL